MRSDPRRNNMTASSRTYVFRFFLLLMALVPMIPQTSAAQLNSNTASVVLTATLVEALTITALPSAVAFNLAPTGEALGSTPVAITTNWILGQTRTTVTLH